VPGREELMFLRAARPPPRASNRHRAMREGSSAWERIASAPGAARIEIRFAVRASGPPRAHPSVYSFAVARFALKVQFVPSFAARTLASSRHFNREKAKSGYTCVWRNYPSA
jgi:hypothetical protein